MHEDEGREKHCNKVYMFDKYLVLDAYGVNNQNRGLYR